MYAYVIDGRMRGPDELGADISGIPADWHVEFVNRQRSPAHYIFMQFGSIGIDRDQAEDIAGRMLAGLNR